MTILVECKCGKEVELELPKLFYNLNRGNCSMVIAGKKCPNPDCNEMIYIEAKLNFDIPGNYHIENTKVDFDAIEAGNVLYFRGFPYEVAFKIIRKTKDVSTTEISIPIIYLRSLSGKKNVVIEVSGNGFLFLINREKDENDSPQYETWTEDQLNAIKANSIGTDK